MANPNVNEAKEKEAYEKQLNDQERQIGRAHV